MHTKKMISQAIERAVVSSALRLVLAKLSFSLFFQEESDSRAQNWLSLLWQIFFLLRTLKNGWIQEVSLNAE